MKLTASALDRVAVCPGSESLPHTRRENPFAKRGTVIHGFLAAVPNIGREAALGAISEKYRADCERIDLDALPVDSARFSSEVAFAFDVETGKGRVLGQDLGRDYSTATENEVVGTADVVGLTEDAVVIPDFKSGHASLEPREMRQLLFLALAATKAYGKPRAISGIVFLREDGSSYFARVEFDEFDLAAFELELRDIVERVRLVRSGGPVVFVEGEHCRYCPAFDYCPAKMALVKAFAAAPESLGALIEGATEDQLASAWERAQALEAVLDRVKDSIRLRARQKPIPLGKGQVLGECPVETLKPEVAAMVLEALHGPEVVEAAIETKTTITKASVERALKRYVMKPGGLKIGQLNENALEAMRAAEGVALRMDVKRRKGTPEELATAVELAPGTDASAELRSMMEAGVQEHAEAMKAGGGV